MHFVFSQYSSLLLIGFVQGLIYTGLLMVRGIRQRRLSDRLLAFLLLVLTLRIAQYMLGFADWYDSHDHHTTFMFYFPFHQLFFVGPLIFFYFKALTNDDFRLRRRHLPHFIPGILLLGIYFTAFVKDLVVEKWMRGQELPEFFNTKGATIEFFEEALEEGVVILWSVSMITYMVLTLRSYFRYRRYLNDHFADQENIRFQWLRNMIYAVILGLAVTWAMDAYELIFECGCLDYTDYWYSHLAIAVLIVWLGITGHINTQILPELHFVEEGAEEENAIAQVAPQEDAAVGVDPEWLEWKERLEAYMKEEQPYLSPGLTLKELANGIGTNASVLSKVINGSYGQNFNDFINQRRVEAVQQAMQNPDLSHLTLIAIAETCGFNSKSTFNRAFRKFSGMSPREYLASKSQ